VCGARAPRRAQARVALQSGVGAPLAPLPGVTAAGVASALAAAAAASPPPPASEAAPAAAWPPPRRAPMPPAPPAPPAASPASPPAPAPPAAAAPASAATPPTPAAPPPPAAAADPPPPVDAAAEAESYKEAGNEQYKAGRYNDAYESYGLAIARAPGVAAYRANRAAAALMLRRWAAALEDASGAVSLDPRHAKAHARAAKAALALGRVAEAALSYRAALALDPSAPGVREEGAGVAVVAGCLEGAPEALAAGDPARALALATRGLERAPAAAPLHAAKVRALLALGRASEAVAAARELDGDGSEALSLRGEALYAAGNMTMAARVYEEALRRDPDAAACARGLKRIRALSAAREAGNAAFGAGDWAEAHARYSAGLALDPSLRSSFAAALRANRAAAAARLGRHADAAEDCSVALELDPENVKAFLRRAAAHTALERHEDAVRDYERAAALAPDTPDIRASIAAAKRAAKLAKRVDYYKLLDLPSTGASEADVKKAYRRAALKWHPDKNASSEAERLEAERMFKLVGEAHAVLSDANKRRKYDAGLSLEEIEQGCEPGHSHGHHGFGGGGFGGGMDDGMDDFMAQYFAAQGFGGGGGFPGGGGFAAGGGGGGFPGGFGGGHGARRPRPGGR
jgi:DnaJ family protein C protein 7